MARRVGGNHASVRSIVFDGERNGCVAVRVAIASQRPWHLSNGEAGVATSSAVESDRHQRSLLVGHARGALVHPGCERMRDQRRASPGAVLRRVKASATERVRHERLCLCVEALLRAGGQAIGGVATVRLDRDDRVLASGVSGALGASATADKAPSNIVGSAFPRLPARRRIPEQAFRVK